MVQIVGGSLSDSGNGVRTNFESEHPPEWFASRYREDGLRGGHVIALGPGNETAARAALAAWPGGLQYGGGVNASNAAAWLDAGASHVIVTSAVFSGGRIDWARLEELVSAVGRGRIVLDLSCRLRDGAYWIVTDRWQRFTEETLRPELLGRLSGACAEFLVHAVDVEGLCQGIDGALVEWLGHHAPLPTTYAGGARSLGDLKDVERLGRGRIDLTIGSALDLFGGAGVRYEDCVAFNRARTHQGKDGVRG